MTQLQRVRRFNRTKHRHYRYFTLTITIAPWMYAFASAVICFGIVAKVFYTIGADMQAYAEAESRGFVSPIPTPTPKPTVIYQPKYIEIASVDLKTEKQQILDYLVRKFGDASADAIQMINSCENGKWDTKAVNHNHNGTCDVGIMQINTVCDSQEAAKLTDYKYNIDRGFEKFTVGDGKLHRSSFYAWTCGSKVNDYTYLDKLQGK